jgi:uncharacterized protein
MPNRKRLKKVGIPPPMEGFRPFGLPLKDLEPVVLFIEEYEAIRLTDYENLNQEEAAERMNISRPTFTRLYEKARKNIAKAFVEGKAILIQGGTYITDDYWYKCRDCNEVMIALKPIDQCRKCDSENIAQLNNPDRTEYCICVSCNTRVPHVENVPCRTQKCPNCGKTLLREGSYHHQLYLKKVK